jgi:hypothetical protein
MNVTRYVKKNHECTKNEFNFYVDCFPLSPTRLLSDLIISNQVGFLLETGTANST